MEHWAMHKDKGPRVAIIDYGMGNLFSVKHACEKAGLDPAITASPDEILSASAVILPGVGAFGDAMEALERLGLIAPLKEAADTKPFMGICLGMQLLRTTGSEFGDHRGLDIISGSVRPFLNPVDSTGKRLKVPQVGWNRIHRTKNPGDPWKESMLEGIDDGEFMYFVHSYYVIPEATELTLSVSHYGDVKFCSSIRHRNIFACQFHPERCGPSGLKIYENLASSLRGRSKGKKNDKRVGSKIRTA